MAKKATKSKKRGFWRVLGQVVLICFLLSIFVTILFRWVNPPVTPLMVIRKVQHGYSIEKKWKPIEEISPNMYKAAIASEDNYFLGHRGFDVIAIDQAVKEREHGRKRGASTISQQTAKNVFLWPRSSWIRKGFEVYYTFLIETFWSKERIMEVYLNVIEMGPGIYGAEAAAQHYFHCSAKHLSARQAAIITACYPAPLKRNPGHPSGYVSHQAGVIQGRMARYGNPKFTKEYISGCQKRYKEAVKKWETKKKRQVSKKRNTRR
ncbi:MAG: monofunctional biosynthetic peptidoglycan transglycosylase [Bacteroidales bacterium]|nr:monofunctional biosynthetic peptidoglycan transglycosylase [Bacteroidales bacterium]